MEITHNYSYGKEEFYNKVNLLFSKLEELDGGTISRNLNESKNRVDFIYQPYNLKGNVQLLEGKIALNGNIHKHTGLFENLFGLINLAKQEEQIEKNLEYAIGLCLKDVFN